MSMESPGDLLERRQQKVLDLKNSGINLYPNDFSVSHTIAEIRTLIEAGPDAAGKNEPEFYVAGRMMAVNRFGKAAFVRFRDRSGQLQAYIRKDQIGEEAYSVFRQLDVGDFAGFVGNMFQTHTGEWTLLVKKFRLLSKTVRMLPEKFHGLKDPEKRYRQRYLDLIMNVEVREIFLRRTRIIQTIRNFLLERDFMEVETPMMQPIPGGAEATPFKTHHNALDMELYLRIAPELYLKRLVVGGFERVFEINRNFRNEGISTKHNPEFTMLEFYQAYATYQELMTLTEEMFRYAALQATGSETITYQGHAIDFGASWRRIPLLTALQEIGGIDRSLLSNRDALLAFADGKRNQNHQNRASGKGDHQTVRCSGGAEADSTDFCNRISCRGIAAFPEKRCRT